MGCQITCMQYCFLYKIGQFGTVFQSMISRYDISTQPPQTILKLSCNPKAQWKVIAHVWIKYHFMRQVTVITRIIWYTLYIVCSSLSYTDWQISFKSQVRTRCPMFQHHSVHLKGINRVNQTVSSHQDWCHTIDWCHGVSNSTACSTACSCSCWEQEKHHCSGLLTHCKGN